MTMVEAGRNRQGNATSLVVCIDQMGEDFISNPNGRACHRVSSQSSGSAPLGKPTNELQFYLSSHLRACSPYQWGSCFFTGALKTNSINCVSWQEDLPHSPKEIVLKTLLSCGA